jgi:hypothetical protein
MFQRRISKTPTHTSCNKIIIIIIIIVVITVTEYYY